MSKIYKFNKKLNQNDKKVSLFEKLEDYIKCCADCSSDISIGMSLSNNISLNYYPYDETISLEKFTPTYIENPTYGVTRTMLSLGTYDEDVIAALIDIVEILAEE